MFNRLKIASKLFIGFGILFLFLAGNSGLFAISSLKSQNSLAELHQLKSDEALNQQVKKSIQEVRMHFAMALALNDDLEWKQADDAIKAADQNLADLIKQTANSGRSDLNQEFAKWFGKYKEVVTKIRALNNPQMDIVITDAGKELISDATKIGTNISNVGDALDEEYANATSNNELKAKQSADLIMMVSISIGVASIFVGLALPFFISRSIRRPIVNLTHAMSALTRGDLEALVPHTAEANEIGEMARAVLVFRDAALENTRLERQAGEHQAQVEMERGQTEAERRQSEAEQTAVVGALAENLVKIAQGDLTARIEAEFRGRYQQIRTDFNAAIARLEETIQGVTESATAITSGSQEISAASDDLSRRTEQQASSLEETAAALEEITVTVHKTAESAKHAREVVAETRGDAEKSGEIVRRAVDAMGKIEKSSREISQIIGVIDEIAFQTNLLALNAGVEAARAGDAGRGFAVVASEVRALAQRSAEAAKEIKSLITASNGQVDNGVKLVAETGASLTRIVTKVSEINIAVNDIAVSAQEQANGLQQVNVAVNQMDQVTQQNAAMAEEASAASQSLSKEIGQMVNLVGQFQTGQADGATELRRELQKVAPHAFRQPARAASGSEYQVETRKPVSKPVRAAARVMVSNGAPIGGDDQGWEEF